MNLRTLIDEIITESSHDAELAEGIDWIREQAKKKDMDPYALAEKIIVEHCAAVRAREWMKSRT